MIDEIRIKDLGVIADTTLQLGAGFTAITGETGAGKTMVVTALGLLMGQRSDAALVRTGSEQARVAGALELGSQLLEAGEITEIVAATGGEIEGNELLISRTVAAAGASKASVGGVRAPISILQQLAEKLFCVHGQTDQLRLRSQTQQRETLDRFGGQQLLAAKETYAAAFKRCSMLEQEHQEITANWQARRREADQLQTETAEIMAVDPQPGESETLQQQISALSNAESLRYALATALNALSGDGEVSEQEDAQTQVARAARAATEIAEFEPSAQQAVTSLEEALELLQEATSELLTLHDSFDEDTEQQLQAAQERLAALKTLERKYGPELADVLEYLNAASAKLVVLDADETRLDELGAELENARHEQQEAAQQLRQLRQEAATQLATAVTAELKSLALPDSQLLIEVRPSVPAQHGADEVLFLLVPHQQAAPRPLAKAASGGELSRIMLALEVVLAQTDPVPTFVFDEIDAGIGGAAAIEVGKRLAQLAKNSQVIVVTHLAQVAAFANNHLRVLKDTNGGFTQSSCVSLDKEARLQEIARLLSGLSDSESALTHAAELLDMGKQI